MDKLEKARRLKALLTQIAPGNSLEALSRPVYETARVGGLESMEAVGPKVDMGATATSGLQKLAENRPAEINETEMFGLEAIVLRENRPVTYVRGGTYDDLADPWRELNSADVKARIHPLLPLIGRIELPPPSVIPYAGTGFIVGAGLIATNRHVAQLFSQGLGTAIRYRTGAAAVNFGREVDTLNDDNSANLVVLNVEMIHPYWDMALLKVDGLPTSGKLGLSIKSPEELVGRNIVVVGYPARDDRNDLALQDSIFERKYFVKRLQPGIVRDRGKVRSFENVVNALTHDASTLGGNSGSAIIDVDSAQVVALHFAGEYLKANYAVPMYELARDGRVAPKLNFDGSLPETQDWAPAWRSVQDHETPESKPSRPAAELKDRVLQSPQVGGGPTKREKTATWTIPLQISIVIGEPSAADGTLVADIPVATRKKGPRESAVFETRGIEGSPTADATLLRQAGFDLDTAVFLAEASSVAYSAADKIDEWARAHGFDKSAFFDSRDVQGFWCVCQDSALLVFRGTSNLGQWLRDVRFLPASYAWGHVHVGFRDGVAAVETYLSDFDVMARRVSNVWVTGHSLGGALAVIAAARLKMKTGVTALLYTYGQPAVGLNDFAERYSVELPQRLWRFVNQSDIVTRVPPGPLYRHVGTVKRIVRPGVLESMQIETIAAELSGDQKVVSKTVIAGGAAEEAAAAVRNAGISDTLLTDMDPLPLSQSEFEQLQIALGAGAELGAESPALEGLLPWFSDHAIGEYIRLLSDIREQSRAVPVQ